MTDSPPKILGLQTTQSKNKPYAWNIDFRSLSVCIEPAGGAYGGFVGETCVCVGVTLQEAITAVEDELLAIRATIPELSA